MIIGKVRNFSEAEREYSLTELVEIAYSEGYKAAQKEFGAVKAANKAAKKAWEKSQIGTSMFKPNVKGVRATNKTLLGGSKVDASINTKAHIKKHVPAEFYDPKDIIKTSRMFD